MPSKAHARTATTAHPLYLLAQAVMVAALGLLLALPLQSTPAFSAGPIGYGKDESDNNQSLARAIKLVERGSYATAITLLKDVIASDPRNPDALSLMGFSQRKLGEREAALDYYARALKLDPQHLGANEYLGELYLEMQDLARAEERLDVLKAACGTTCAEYRQLEKAIASFKAGG